MHPKTEREARKWAGKLNARGLKRFVRMLENNDQRLICDNFEDPENPFNGCLATQCGRLDPECRGEVLPGTAWLTKVGIGKKQGYASAVVTEWDAGTLSLDELAAIFAAELDRRVLRWLARRDAAKAAKAAEATTDEPSPGIGASPEHLRPADVPTPDRKGVHTRRPRKRKAARKPCPV